MRHYPGQQGVAESRTLGSREHQGSNYRRLVEMSMCVCMCIWHGVLDNIHGASLVAWDKHALHHEIKKALHIERGAVHRHRVLQDEIA